MTSNLVFTLCAGNYLAHALTLGESIRKTNPEWSFVIGLVDECGHLGVDNIGEAILPVSELRLDVLPDMVLRYNVIELCTAVKPHYFRFLFRTHHECEHIVYLDPDTYVFGSLQPVLDQLGDSIIGCTPHALTPIPLDGLEPQDNLFLNHGTFNLGFLVLCRRRNEEFLTWWSDRTVRFCRIDLKEGYFVDQLWLNLAPIYFGRDFAVLKHAGLNVAFWNLHERQLSDRQGVFEVNGHPLIFFHFSLFKPEDPLRIAARGLTRFSSESRRDVVPLLLYYRERLLTNNYDHWRSFVPFYSRVREARLHELEQAEERGYSFRRRIFKGIRRAIPASAKQRLRCFVRE